MTPTKTPVPTLVDLLRDRAATRPSAPAFTFLVDGERREATLSYRELDERARAVAARLQAMGATGERAVLLYAPGPEYVVAFFGCLYAGVVAVPAYPPDPARFARTLPRLRSLVHDARAAFLLTTSDIAALTTSLLGDAQDLRSRTWLTTDEIAPAAASAWREPEIGRRTLAFLQYTSGSTGDPKGVMLRHDNLLHNLALIHQTFGMSADATTVIWLPPYHDMGLIGGVLTPIFSGAPVVLMSPLAFLQRPMRWLEAISRHRGRVSGGPNFAYELCVRKSTPAEREALDLHDWSVAFTGAEPIRAATLDRFFEAFGPAGFRRASFHPCYGLAEATLLVTGGRPVSVPVVRSWDVEGAPRTLVGCGRPLPGHPVRVVDPASLRECAPGELGEIWVAGPSVADGYWGRPDDSEQVFRARMADGSGPYLRTGDLGLFAHDHEASRPELFVAGRLKDLIIIRGRNVHPQDIELTAEQAHGSLRSGCGAAFSIDGDGEEQLALVYEIDARRLAEAGQADPARALEGVAAAIRAAIAAEHNLHVNTIALVRAGSIHKTSSGKIQRRACKQALLGGSLELVFASRAAEASAPDGAVEPPARDGARAGSSAPDDADRSVRSRVRATVARHAGVPAPSVTDTEPLSSLGLDSLRSIELAGELASEHGIELSLSWLLGATVAEIAYAIETAPRTERASAPREPTMNEGQRALWLLAQIEPESTAYTVARQLRVRSRIEVTALRRALDALVTRHPALRSTFPAEAGEPRLRLSAARTAAFEVRGLAASGDQAGDGDAREAVAREARRPFDLARGPLFRVVLFSRGEDDHVLYVAAHHIICDFASLVVLLRDLGALYRAAREADAAPQVVELSVPHVPSLDTLPAERQATIWRYWDRLARQIPPLALATDRPRSRKGSGRGASFAFELPPPLSRDLAGLGHARRATPFQTLLAAWAALLQRYTGQTDVVIGAPITHRGRPEMAEAVGYLLDVLPIRADLLHAETFGALVDQVRARTLEAIEHRVPLPRLVEYFHPEREAGRSPLFQTLFTMLHSSLVGPEAVPFVVGSPGGVFDLGGPGGLRVESLPLVDVDAKFDISLTIAAGSDRHHGLVEYNADLFDAATIERLMAHFRTLIADAVARPEAPIATLALLTESERTHLAAPRAGGWLPAPARSVPELIAAQVARTPDAVAVVAGGVALSYAELDRRANQLAHWLRGRGVGPDVLVGVSLSRSAEMIVAVLAILKAGGGYLPVDPALPSARARFILEDARATLLVSESGVATAMTGVGLQPLLLDALSAEIAQQPEDPPAPSPDPEHLAYVLYTSGSTGQPKGVEVPHRAFVNLLAAMQESPGMSAADVLVAVTTLSFDIAGLELFLPLTVGARVVVARRDETFDPEALQRLLDASGATVMQATPATWRMLVAAGWRGGDGFTVLCGGEAMAPDLAADLCERAGRVFNLYGPTETTIWSTTAQVRPGEPITIGSPIRNTEIQVLDPRLQPVPQGAVGELYLGGEGLARGYLRRPELTAERFIHHPLRPDLGERLYRTGDLVRMRADGALEYIGRADQQVKIRGFRVELGEVEAALLSHDRIRAATALVRTDAPGHAKLVAYVVTSGPVEPGELRSHLKQRLPDYMVPAAVVELDALPLTPSGKVDRRALPAPRWEASARAYVAPRSPLEGALARIIKESLGVEQVGIHDDLFELGADSLLAPKIAARVHLELALELPLRVLFERPNVAALAEALQASAPASRPALVALPRASFRRSPRRTRR